MLDLSISTPLKKYAKQNLGPHPKDEQVLSQLLLLQKQTDLICQIHKIMGNTRKCRTGFDDVSNFSVSTLENSHFLTSSKSTFSLHKDQNSFFESSLEEVLNEIKWRCSKKTYNLVRQRFRALDQNRMQSRLQKEIKYNQQLMRRCLKLSHEVSEYKVKFEAANEKIKLLEKSRITKDQPINIEKSQIFIKWEKSMVHKEKLQAEVKKCLNRQFSSLEEEKKINERIRQQISFILQRLESNSENSENSADIKSIAKEVRINLEEQRGLAKKQQDQFYAVQNELQRIFKQLEQIIGLHK